ncbi:MAG: M67 family metallopeptidase [Anaerolineales bacterium]|nr:M67 family metallopeptidase [Anaerolineales bacterium]
MPTELTLTENQTQKMIAHAQAALPNEACGLLGGKDGHVQAVYPGANAELSPARYRMDPQEQLLALDAIKLGGEDLLGIFHSHPEGQVFPSATDIAQAYYPDAVYIILARPRSGKWQMHGYDLRNGRSQKVVLQIEPEPATG